MKQINCSVQGVPVPPPTLVVDTQPGIVHGADVSEPGRAIFRLPDSTPPHGATVTYGSRTARTVIPAAPGSYEGGLLTPPLPVLVYGTTGLRIVGDRFYTETGELWLWQGATDMNLPYRFLRGDDITPILEQRIAAGATLLRSLAMGWPFVPSGDPFQFPDYWDGVDRYLALLEGAALYCEWVVFAGTRFVMPEPARQQDFYAETQAHLRDTPHVLELCNEWNHGSQALNPQAFAKPAGMLASHGSGLTDAPPVEPFWDFATYHARREPDGRGFTNLDPYEFQRDYPKPCPFVPDESAKPENYGGNEDYAYRMGQHAACGCGGTYHSQAGVESRLWSDVEDRCARAFYRGVRGAR